MKAIIPALIVVEGVTDVQWLSTFIDADFVTTNGSALSVDTIEFIRRVQQSSKEVIVLTDPDYPGEQIRNKLNQAIPNLSNAFIDKAFAISKGKVGVAQASKETILQSLRNKITAKKASKGSLTLHDLFVFGLVGQPDSVEKRQRVGQHFHLGYTNAKTMLQRFNVLGVSKDEIAKVI